MFNKKIKLKLASIIIGASMFSGMYIPTNCVVASAETVTTSVFSSSFESDDTNSWWGSGNAKIATVSTGAKDGTNCLAVTGRTATYMGPQTDLISKIQSGKTYKTSVWVKFEGTGTHKFKVTLDNKIDGTQNYTQMTDQVEVTAGQWAEIKGAFTCPTGEVTQARPYVECDNATTDFYIDDFNITTEAEETSDGEEAYAQSFESGLDNWGVRGSAVLSQDSSQYKDGNKSLKISGRTKSWEGPAKDFTKILTKGQNYHFSAYIMYNDANGATNQTFDLKFENTTTAATVDYESVASVTAAKGVWTKIEGDYTIPSDADLSKYSLYIELPYKSNDSVTDSDKIDFYLDNIVITKAKVIEKDYQKDIPQLKNVFSDYFPVGTAVLPSQIESNDVHSEFIKYQYNAIVPGNCMKIDALQPTEGNFKWDDADKVVKFAADNNMVLRGHTLVWHSQVPDWFFQDKDDSSQPASRELLLERMKTHIDTVMGRYKGQIDYWDVCNEVISDSSGLRDSKWRSIIGDVDGDGYDSDYIELAFKYAHEADPNAKLIINDYGEESSTRKRDDLYNLVKRMLEKGIPVDGVGLQMHISMYSPSADQIQECIEKFASLKSIDPDFTVQVTELDMSIYSNNSETTKTVTDAILEQQAAQYKEIFDVYKEEAHKDNLSLVMLWGTSDDSTWLDNHPVAGRPDAPLLFDRNLQAKPAYWSVIDTNVTRQTVNSINATPTIGTDVDLKWQMTKAFDVDSYVTGTDGAIAKVKTMWDTKNVYVLADVTDETINDSDSVDIYLDNGNGGYNVYTVNRTTNTDTIKVNQTSTGYEIQAMLPLGDIEAAIGTKVSFDMKINDYDSNGNINSSVVWNDNVSEGTLVVNNGGILSLGKASKLVEAKKGTPSIDANIDEIWSSANVISTDVILSNDDTAKANVKVLWDKNYIYALYEVTDDILDKTSANVYEQDSVEAFIDENNARASAYDDDDDAQYRVNYDNEQSGAGNMNTDLFKSATKKTDTGYMVEMAIPLKNEAAVNQVLGFDAQVNDATGGVRNGINIWCDETSQTWTTMSNIGNVLLVDSTLDNVLGDTNGDSEITILDYIVLQKYILDNSTDINTTNSDLNKDGKINSADLLAVRKIILNS